MQTEVASTNATREQGSGFMAVVPDGGGARGRLGQDQGTSNRATVLELFRQFPVQMRHRMEQRGWPTCERACVLVVRLALVTALMLKHPLEHSAPRASRTSSYLPLCLLLTLWLFRSVSLADQLID